ncbi:TPA: restriction endonuclease subunit S [Aeromonas hydrophila]|uniref:restriction endonuclease subunit S n=1 Tax=Aeromonas caviae TaxID=648 RepID=UPI001A2BD590|nr:restriction endonuclease subunit S [Aeromonas caviae]MEE1914385.1 restriction endonuclease subunit S [Aeromonas caviae]HAU4887856.1 restriction endonuclease subunit S [Aeromonas hydrophila]
MAEQMMQEAAGKTIPAGYKQTEVGVIPEDWDIASLGSLLKETPRYGINAPAVPLTGDTPVYIRITDISDDGYFSPGEKVGVNSPLSGMYFLSAGDIVLARTGASVGKSYLYNKNDGQLVYAGFLIKVSPNQERLSSMFLSQYLKSHQYWNWVVVNSMRSGQPGINGSEYANLLIPTPTIEEQTAIANVLSDSDALIDALEQLIAKKQAIKTATMQQLLTGRTRLPAFTLRPDGTKKGYKTSELGEIPEDWEVMTYGEIFTFLSTSTNSRADLSNIGEYGYIHYGDIHTKFNNALDLNEFNLPRISSHLASSSFVENGDVVMADASEDYEGIGKSVEICNVGSKKVVAGLHTFLLRDKNKYMADGYRGYLHCIPAVKNAFDRLATGMKVYGLSKNNLAVVPVPVPSQKEQTAIATILSDMDNELQTLTQKLEKARALKQGMMQQLLTGKIRLPLAAGA